MYTLKVPEPPQVPASPSTIVIGVEHFSAVAPIDDSRILRYESPTQLKYYDEDRWVSEPTTMIPELSARYLERMGIAHQARVLPWVESMDYILQGQILSFEEVVSGERREARVALELTLLRFPARQVVWDGTFRSLQPVSGDGVSAVVDALSAATHQVLKEGLTALSAQLPR
jgi:ABC-type uncharacterized transport system auxiliary subunit